MGRAGAFFAVAIGAGVLALPGVAHADGKVASACPGDAWQCRRAAVAFDHSESLPIEWNFDSGWVPPSGDVQVHLWGGVYAHTRVTLKGEARTEWPSAPEAEPLTLTVPGYANGGQLAYHYGVEVGAEGKVQISVAGQSYSWQGDLPYVPQVDFQVEASEIFDAWGWPPGASASDITAPQTVAQLDVASLIGVSIPGISGGFELDVALELEASYVNDRLVVTRVDGESIAGGDFTAGGEARTLAYANQPFLELDLHPEGTVAYEGVLHLIPAFYVSLLGSNWSIPLADIPVDLPPVERAWVFEAERVHMPLPVLELPVAYVDFGEVPIGEVASDAVDVINTGELAARMTLSIEQSSASSPGFATDGWVSELEPGASSAGAVHFAPEEARTYLGVITVASNDPDAPEQEVLLYGVGIDPSAAPVAPDIVTESGCGCRSAGRPARRFGLIASMLALLVSWARARRASPVAGRGARRRWL